MPGRPSKSILVAHADPTLAARVAEGLCRQGMTVFVATDGHDAMSKILTLPLDAMLVDVGLPKLDGAEILRTVRMLGKSLPAVIVGRPTGEAKLALEGARSMGTSVTTETSDPSEMARLLSRLLEAPGPEGGRTDPASGPDRREPSAPPAGSERRRFQRVQFQDVVHYQTTQELHTAYFTDVSQGGIFIETQKVLEVGTRLILRFAIPGRAHSILVPGEVVRVEKAHGTHPLGMGVEFQGVDAATKQTIYEFVAGVIASGEQGIHRIGEGASPMVPAGAPPAARARDSLLTPPAARGRPALSFSRLEVRFPSYEGFLAEYDSNIRHNGLFVPVSERIEEGTKVAVEVYLPDWDQSIHVEGEVVSRVEADPTRSIRAGIALQLRPVDSPAVRLLHMFASAHRGVARR